MRTLLCVLLLVLPSACGGPATAPATPPASPEPEVASPEVASPEAATPEVAGSDGMPRCGDPVGAWSSPVDGLRARIVTTGTQAPLRIEVELENLSAHPIALHWDGSPSVGFVTFALRDAQGAEPMPDWAFGGNEMVGSIALMIGPSATTRRDAMAAFVTGPGGGRALRIGAFWGRSMPDEGSPRYLSGRLTTRASQAGDTTEDGASVRRAAAWVGTLDLPPVCLGSCAADADCVLVDICGCECHAQVGPPPTDLACTETCERRPCEGHQARCRAGACVME